MANSRFTPNLDALLEKLRNPQPLLENLGKECVVLTQIRFATKTTPDGAGWAPWATSTVLARNRAGNVSAGVLVLTGLMRDSVSYEVRGNKLVIINNAPYASYNQYGTTKSPAREFMGYGYQEQKATATLWSQWVNSKG